MTNKILATLAGVVAILAVAAPASAQRVELLLQDDQLLKNGRSAVHSGNLEKARYYYEEALKRKSLSRLELITVHSDLCVTYMYLELFEKAIVQCETSLDLQPNKWETVNNLGTVYLVMGDYSKAILTYEKGLKMKPNSKILLFNLDIAQKRLQEARIRKEIEMEKRGIGEGENRQKPALQGLGSK